MHYLLVGPGALGCLLYSIASKGMKSTDKFTILDYNSDRAELLSNTGITYHNESEKISIPVTASSSPEDVGEVDVAMLCVKSYDVQDTIDFCEPVLGDKTLLLFLQNGISHLNLRDCKHKATAAYGTTTEGATLLEAGHVRHAGNGVTYLGFLDQPDEHFVNALKCTADVLSTAGLQVHLTRDVLSRIWGKLFINVGINALTATLDCKNGELLSIKGAADRMQTAVAEAYAIAKSLSIKVSEDPYLFTRDVCEKTAANVSSMLQDVRKKRLTEIEAINGAVVAMGKKSGIKTPENDLLCRQVKEIEATYDKC
jgi:2-dehydropantoate 2-reductase